MGETWDEAAPQSRGEGFFFLEKKTRNRTQEEAEVDKRDLKERTERMRE